MSNGDPLVAVIGELRNPRSDCSVEPCSWRPDHNRTKFRRPRGDVLIITDHGDGERGDRANDALGKPASQGCSFRCREDGRQALFGFRKTLDLDEDGLCHPVPEGVGIAGANDGVHGHSVRGRGRIPEERASCIPSSLKEMEGTLAVIGAGSWGTAIASIAAPLGETLIWARSQTLADEIAIEHTNHRYLPDVALSTSLDATSDLERALDGASVVLCAIPSHGTRAVLEQAAPLIRSGTPVISLSKGIEDGTMQRMSEVIAEVVPHAIPGVLTGPNLAREIALGQPAACVVASEQESAARLVQRALHSTTLRVYSSPDVIGCEVAGATKNVLAIAAGITDGLGFGENTRAALITRGLAEMGRLGLSMGGQTLTFGGLAGVGDLIATCTSEKSRNRTVGVALGQGRDLVEIISSMHMVAEGVKTAGPLTHLANQHGVELPISEQVAAIVAGTTTPRRDVLSLMGRPARVEWDEDLYRGIVQA